MHPSFFDLTWQRQEKASIGKSHTVTSLPPTPAAGTQPGTPATTSSPTLDQGPRCLAAQHLRAAAQTAATAAPCQATGAPSSHHRPCGAPRRLPRPLLSHMGPPGRGHTQAPGQILRVRNSRYVRTHASTTLCVTEAAEPSDLRNWEHKLGAFEPHAFFTRLLHPHTLTCTPSSSARLADIGCSAAARAARSAMLRGCSSTFPSRPGPTGRFSRAPCGSSSSSGGRDTRPTETGPHSASAR